MTTTNKIQTLYLNPILPTKKAYERKLAALLTDINRAGDTHG